MPFTIPNSSGTYVAGQAEPDTVDIAVLAAGFSANGVISGASATATTSSLVVALSSGIIFFGGTKLTIASGNLTASSGDATNPRYDLLTAATSGAYALVMGTASSAPVFPTPGSTVVVLGALYVPAAATVASSSQIVDKRVLISEYDANIPAGRFVNNTASTNYYMIPGTFGSGAVTTLAVTGADFFNPFFVSSTITVDQLAFEVSTASVAVGVTARMAIYKRDIDGQPTTLMVDSGTVATTSAGVRTVTLGTALVLPPGRYCTAIACSSSVTVRALRTAVLGQPISEVFGTSPYVGQMRNARAYAAFPDPANKWTTQTVSSLVPGDGTVFLRISVP